MPYHISRNGQNYGPYTLDDLERYVASGHVLLTDLCRSDDDTSWRPVAEVLHTAGRPPATPTSGYGAAAYTPGPPSTNLYAPGGPQAPPNLHWGLVLLFDVLTCSIFQLVWNIIMGAWFRRVAPPSKTLWLYIASAVLLVIQSITQQALGLMSGGRHGSIYNAPYNMRFFTGTAASFGLIVFITWITRLVARFNFRSELELHYNTVDPIGLRINPVLTFFFGGIYLQSILNHINEVKRLQAYGVLPR